MASPAPTAKTIWYSDFIQMVRAGQVLEVVIEDPRLLENLEQHGVKFTERMTDRVRQTRSAFPACGLSPPGIQHVDPLYALLESQPVIDRVPRRWSLIA